MATRKSSSTHKTDQQDTSGSRALTFEQVDEIEKRMLKLSGIVRICGTAQSPDEGDLHAAMYAASDLIEEVRNLLDGEAA